MSWLDPTRQALDARTDPLAVFFRDDDAGWAEARLLDLVDRFAGAGIPLDLAVIPDAIQAGLAATLLGRAESEALSLHQHGWSHQNHEPAGRRSEFGPARSPGAQLADIERGRRRLEGMFGSALAPIFTPPWNRCTRDTGEALVQAGIQLLSCDSTAPALGLPGLRELPVSLDWQRRRRPEHSKAEERGTALAAAVASSNRLGVMLHHAAMDPDDDTQLDELLRLLADHPAARCRAMAALAGLAVEGVA